MLNDFRIHVVLLILNFQGGCKSKIYYEMRKNKHDRISLGPVFLDCLYRVYICLYGNRKNVIFLQVYYTLK